MEVLEHFSYIHYVVQFKKNMAEIRALIDSESELNAMALTYMKKLDLLMQKTDIEAQKIDRSILQTYGIVIAGF